MDNWMDPNHSPIRCGIVMHVRETLHRCATEIMFHVDLFITKYDVYYILTPYLVATSPDILSCP